MLCEAPSPQMLAENPTSCPRTRTAAGRTTDNRQVVGSAGQAQLAFGLVLDGLLNAGPFSEGSFCVGDACKTAAKLAAYCCQQGDA